MYMEADVTGRADNLTYTHLQTQLYTDTETRYTQVILSMAACNVSRWPPSRIRPRAHHHMPILTGYSYCYLIT